MASNAITGSLRRAESRRSRPPHAWSAAADVERELAADIEAARSPSAAARALDQELGGPPAQRRYTAPSYVIARTDNGCTATIAGFNAVEAYETAIANLASELVHRPKPEQVADVLAWAGHPVATAEVAAIAHLDVAEARADLGRVGHAHPAGDDFYWTAK